MRKKTIALVLSVVLVLALLLSACTTDTTPTETSTPTTSTPTTTAPPATQVVEKVVEPVYKVLNPQGSYIPVETEPIAERLDTLAGKNILYYESEATNMHMPTLLEWLKEDYPTATFNVVHTESFGSSNPSEEELTNQAVIRGIGW